MPRFVVLWHECEPTAGRQVDSHYDLMLEADGVLRTWAIARWPEVGESVSAEPLVDHRLAYLDYEGELSGGRGSVKRIDRGEFVQVADADGTWEVELLGSTVMGRYRLGGGQLARRTTFEFE
jgi:hypothetical protein